MGIESVIIVLAFFYLLSPRECATTKSESRPFWFKDVKLYQWRLHLNLIKRTDDELLTALFIALVFDLEKNSVREVKLLGIHELEIQTCALQDLLYVETSISD